MIFGVVRQGELGCGRDEVLFVSPSDPVIRPEKDFLAFVGKAAEIAAQGHIVTFGVQPFGPETGYGYIMAGEEIGDGSCRVAKFTEKPDRDTAYAYLQEGGFYWNSGMFAFQAGVLLDEVEQHAPEIHAVAREGYRFALENFAEMPNISIDYAIMEKSERVVMLPMDIYWNDIGSWDSFFEVMERDENGNLPIGDVMTIDTKDTLVMSEKRLIATVGLRDLLVVETDDAILITRRGDAQDVRKVVQRLKKEKRREAVAHLTTYRPWGHYTILEQGPRYQIRRIMVNSGTGLTSQLHHHRSEHWVVVKGTARVVRNGKVHFVHESESFYIPKSTPHVLDNPGRVPLEMIEVQMGDYLSEDDIVRLDGESGGDSG